MRVIITSFIILLSFTALSNEKFMVLYGYKLGQSLEIPMKKLGKPIKVQHFKDGFVSVAYKDKDTYVVFEARPQNKDVIWSIQILGESNPQFHGLGDINLGDTEARVIKILGKPDSSKVAKDIYTGQEMKGIRYLSYYKKSNFSIEIRNKKVFSIKMIMNSHRKPQGISPLNGFLKTVKEKNYYKTADKISAFFSIIKEKEKVYISDSMVNSLMSNEALKDILYNEKYGVVSIKPKDIINASMRMQINAPSGMVYYIKKGKKRYDLFFARTYEGWVLFQVIFLKE